MATHRHIWQGENLMGTYALHCDCGWVITLTNSTSPEQGITGGFDPTEVQKVLASATVENERHPIQPGRFKIPLHGIGQPS